MLGNEKSKIVYSMHKLDIIKLSVKYVISNEPPGEKIGEFLN